jgi:hypothetical protein
MRNLANECRSLYWFGALLPILTFTACCHLGRPPLKDRAEAIITLQRNEFESQAKIAKALRRISADELKPDRLRTYDTRTLEVLFEALHLADGMMDREDLVPAMEAIFVETFQNRSFIFDMPKSLQDSYIQHRMWAKARDNQMKNHVGDAPLPQFVENEIPAGPAVYDVSEDGRTLTLRPVSLSSGSLIVSVLNPNCHFCQQAEKAISEDHQLMQAFSNSLNVYPAIWSLDLDDITKANKEGKFRYVILYKASQWPGMEFDSTPYFYFFKDGKIVYKLDGWGPGALGKLKEGLKMIAERRG